MQLRCVRHATFHPGFRIRPDSAQTATQRMIHTRAVSERNAAHVTTQTTGFCGNSITMPAQNLYWTGLIRILPAANVTRATRATRRNHPRFVSAAIWVMTFTPGNLAGSAHAVMTRVHLMLLERSNDQGPGMDSSAPVYCLASWGLCPVCVSVRFRSFFNRVHPGRCASFSGLYVLSRRRHV